MPSILRISEAASLALHTMYVLAKDPAGRHTTRELADDLGASENHLAKVLQRLTKVGLVRSVRGPKGGFLIGREPDSITLLNVFEAIEGPMDFCNCLLDAPFCGGEEYCILGGMLSSINGQVREYLAGVRLSQLDDRPRFPISKGEAHVPA